jgi:hypothetical protein
MSIDRIGRDGFVRAAGAWLLVSILAAVAAAQTPPGESPPASPPPSEAPPPTPAESDDIEISIRPLDLDTLFTLRIAEEDATIEVGGRFVLDLMRYSYANRRPNGFELDDARLYLEGSLHPFRFRIEPDLVGVDTRSNLWEAWAAFEPDPAFRVTAGQFRIALGSEYATRPEDFPLVGYAFPSYAAGRYDVGLRANGTLFEEGLWYEAAATLGNGFDPQGIRRSNPQYSARAVGHPFRWIDLGTDLLDGFFVGVGAAYSPDGDQPIVLGNPYEQTVLRTSRLDGDSVLWEAIEAGYHWGPFLVGWETVNGTVENVPIGGGETDDLDQLGAWSAYASWNLTGEDQVWKEGGWRRPETGDATVRIGDNPTLILPPGRWELSARYSNADMDRNLFEYGFTDYGQSTQEVRTFSLDLSWIPRSTLRVALGWVKTIADDDLATFGETKRDSSFVLRFEVAF